jgi:uncharacterized protein
MIAVDTNILVYAHRVESVFHIQALQSMQSLAENARPWGIPVVCLHEFLAIVTHPKIFKPASSQSQAAAQIDAWLSAPNARILHSGSQHWRVLSVLAEAAKPQGGQYQDARIAAICMENGVSLLWTADRDFGRYKALKTLNPVV